MRLFEIVFILLFAMLWTELDCGKPRPGKKSSDQATQRSGGASHSLNSRNNVVIALPANRNTAGVETHLTTSGRDEGTSQTARRRGRLPEERRAQQEYILENRRSTRSQLLGQGVF
uniref:Secreted protein n=1 Tax=Meloidogyne floridensis TaxID=298350 RepID=A0A915NM29_9BILA